MFHITYRPDNFESFLGNESNLKSLKEVIKKPDHPHCYIFYGLRGSGKTTLARILENEFNCQDNVYELNSANNRGIDSARQIIDNCQFKSLNGKNKLFILDEVHQATKDFQNSMLKILEDTPKDCYFILCTTEIEKIIKTIRDRCFCFKVEKLDYNNMMKLLKSVYQKENGKCPISALKKIIEKSETNRQALIILEKIIYMDNEDEINKIIDEFQESIESIELCRAMLKDWESVKEVLKKLDESEDIERLRRMILSYFSKMILNANKDNAIRAGVIIQAFSNNFFDSGKAGFISKCLEIFL